MAARSSKPTADICLVLEGTYPYVRGGVSTWVHQILELFPEHTFALFYLGAQKDLKAKKKYDLPSNVLSLDEVYIFQDKAAGLFARKPDAARWRSVYENIRRLSLRAPQGDLHDLEVIRNILQTIDDESSVSFDAFWQHHETWDVVREVYERYAPDDSFLDFYWTLRFLIMPLWRLARGSHLIPKARLYHTACTGYAGLAAAMAASANKAPLVLTEHGIYLRERIADICRSQWIPDQIYQYPNLNDPLGTLRRLWIGFFDVIGKMCYARSDSIVSLFDKNARAQEHFGADPHRIRIIPNGIRTEVFEPLIAQRTERRKAQPESQVVGFLGRVVSIKDVKTLLRTAAKVVATLPDAKFLIAGPTEEEPDYYQECLELSAQLHLTNNVEFLGTQKMMEFLPRLDIMILTSISEGLPFVIIESLAAGVPVVSTDVGACSEILNGRPDESPPIGPAGLIAPVGNAEEIAAQVVALLTQPEELNQLALNGIARAKASYHEKAIQHAYAELYTAHLSGASTESQAA